MKNDISWLLSETIRLDKQKMNELEPLELKFPNIKFLDELSNSKSKYYHGLFSLNL